jgi:lipoprotein-anchoring transpeptidase ErfK/SrfK
VARDYVRSRRGSLAPFVLASVIGLLATGCASGGSAAGNGTTTTKGSTRSGGSTGHGTTGHGGASKHGATTTHAPTSSVRLAITPASGSVGVSPGDPITVTATDGTIKTVVVTGDQITGSLNSTRTQWRSSWTLPVQAKLTVTATGVDASGRPLTLTSTFRTLTPKETFTTQIFEGYRQVYGVGMPIMLTFSRPITNRQAVERSLEITTSKPVVGAWYWDNSKTLFFRPRDYWPADTTVSFTGRLDGVEGAPGVYGYHTLNQQFTIGRSLIVVASTRTHRLRLYRNGKLIRNWPISTGRPGDNTPNGTYLTIEKHNPVLMKGPGYRIEVPWSVRFTWSGDYLHDAYWSVGEQGFTNVSHGCVNMAPADAEYYYKMAKPGNPVTVIGSPRAGAWDNGWTQWFLTWKQFLRGSALHEAVLAGPHGSKFVNPATLPPSTATAPIGKPYPGNAFRK